MKNYYNMDMQKRTKEENQKMKIVDAKSLGAVHTHTQHTQYIY